MLVRNRHIAIAVALVASSTDLQAKGSTALGIWSHGARAIGSANDPSNTPPDSHAEAAVTVSPTHPPCAEEQRRLNLESFDRVWTTVQDKHWDPKLGGLDWEGVYNELRPRIKQAQTVTETRAVLKNMLSRLGQSHFDILPGDIYEQIDTPTKHDSPSGVSGITVCIIDGRALVKSVVSDSPAAGAGVRSGWEITHINDECVASKIKKIGRELEETSRLISMLVRAVDSMLSGSIGETIAVRFDNGTGQAVELSVPLAERIGRKIQLGHFPPIYVSTEVRTIDENIGYIFFSAFVDPPYISRVFDKSMSSFMDAAGIIIDLRGNPGGIGLMAQGMAGWLIAQKDCFLGTTYTRNGEHKLFIYPRPTTYTGPVAVLVDELSGSAAELFASGLKDLGRARVFGSPTEGAALASMIDKLPNGDVFLYAVGDYVSAGGQSLEGVGVTPDVEVTPTRKALLEGRDEVLQAAVDWIRHRG